MNRNPPRNGNEMDFDSVQPSQSPEIGTMAIPQVGLGLGSSLDSESIESDTTTTASDSNLRNQCDTEDTDNTSTAEAIPRDRSVSELCEQLGNSFQA